MRMGKMNGENRTLRHSRLPNLIFAEDLRLSGLPEP